jgi:demethylspheroidene O-methyltransferase
VVRWIARRRMRALFDLCSGFVYSQVLLACVRLELFDILAREPQSGAVLASRLDVPPASMDRLLEAAESLQLVEDRGSRRFGLGPLGAALRGNPAVAMMVEHHAAFYRDLDDPVALLRGDKQATELGRFWAYSNNERPASLASEDTAAYSELMAASQTMIADQVLAAYSLRRHVRLLDIGGGAGEFALAALRRHEHLQVSVFDLPPVAHEAAERFERLGFGERASARAGDFISDPLPTGHDVISLVRVLHDHDDDHALQLLRAVRRVISPDGVLLIAEPMLGTRGAEPVAAAYFGFYLLAMGQGRPRDADTLGRLLRDAGFATVHEHRTSAPLLVRVLTARASSG